VAIPTSKTAEQIFIFMDLCEEAYAAELTRLFQKALKGIQKTA